MPVATVTCSTSGAIYSEQAGPLRPEYRGKNESSFLIRVKFLDDVGVLLCPEKLKVVHARDGFVA